MLQLWSGMRNKKGLILTLDASDTRLDGKTTGSFVLPFQATSSMRFNTGASVATETQYVTRYIRVDAAKKINTRSYYGVQVIYDNYNDIFNYVMINYYSNRPDFTDDPIPIGQVNIFLFNVFSNSSIHMELNSLEVL